jgi:serine protease Do
MRANWQILLALAVVGFFLPLSRGEEPNPRRTPIVQAVRKSRPAIVAIQVEKKDSGDWARETVGTGVVIDERGYILTSHHLVNRAYRVRVRLHNGDELNAEVVADDQATDLAVLRVEAKRKLLALRPGTSGDLLLGEPVIAIGHPFGAGFMVSQGIVSAVDQAITLPTSTTLSGLIQTDASINPGNSGGPILNANGEWIGVIVALRENARGIAYALNIDTVQRVLPRLVGATGVAGVEHGIACREGPFRGEIERGVIVAPLPQSSPAARSGLRAGDAIFAIGANRIGNSFDVERAFWDCSAGDRMEIRFVRDARELSAYLTLAAVKPPRARESRGRAD